MKTPFVASSLLFASAALLLAGCVKMPKPGSPDPDDPDSPDNPDFPPPRNTSIPSAMNPGR